MKTVLLTLLLFYGSSSFAQLQKIDSIPTYGFILKSGWKFQADDNPDFAKPAYDDNSWKPIDPTLDIHELPQVAKGIGWFRLHLLLNSNLLKKQLALVINQSGASEIYLDGRLIYTAGLFDTDLSKLKAYDPAGRFIALPLNDKKEQVLAVRFALQPGVRYTTIFESPNSAFSTTINTMEEATAFSWRYMYFLRGTSFFVNGIFFIFAVLHFCFFLFYRSKKANLYFSLFAFMNMLGFFIFMSYEYIPWVDRKFFVFNLAADIIFTGQILMFTALHLLFEQKRNWWYFVLVGLSLLSIVLFALPGYWGWNVASRIISILINLEITRVSLLAVKKKRRGAWIVAAGCICYLLCWTFFILFGKPGSLDPFTGIVFTLSFISIPLSISIHLGVDFSFTNRLLQKKLIEVNELSGKNIAQEKEKQQLLADQNTLLETQVTQRTASLNQSLDDLKATQAQLIQSEKMASLGQLTAGIAHEIQNPLNFVNNFSDINGELIDDLKAEAISGNSAEVIAIANDLKANEEKINHHGKRADAIVKGMLEHSRQGTAEKQMTNINALADEYLKLAYQSLRAKDDSSDVSMKTEFDAGIGKVNIVPQDIGRVLLNIYNNAFYAASLSPGGGVKDSASNHAPTVWVSTKKENNKIKISVKDNGPGIPADIIDKIFQPFFTTKPTGSGTGLGLSLAYDIVKAHGGKIKVESKEGEGSEFIIVLPIMAS